jgi:aspartokinase
MTNEPSEIPLSPDLQNQAGEHSLQGASPDPATGCVKAIEFKKALSVVTIISTRKLPAFLFLQKVFELCEKQAIAFDLVTVSEIAVSIVLDDLENLRALRQELAALARIRIENHKAAISLSFTDGPGKGLLPGRVFQAIESINISFTTLSEAGRRLAFVINESELEVAAFILFEQFFDRRAASTGN